MPNIPVATARAVRRPVNDPVHGDVGLFASPLPARAHTAAQETYRTLAPRLRSFYDAALAEPVTGRLLSLLQDLDAGGDRT